MIKHYRTINARLDGEIETGREKEYCSIFTVDEENTIVRFIQNKNRCLQGLNKRDLTEVMLNVLRIRDYAYRKYHGRRVQKLSAVAKHALETGKLSKSFWKRWDAKYAKVLTKKRQGTVSMNRALNCTKEMAISHIDELAEELIEAGIFTNAVKQENGIWTGDIDTSRIFNHDETPQFVNYGVDGTPNGLIYCGKGESCQKMIRENRECVTVHPFVTVDGHVAMCHVIFKGKGISQQMAPAVAVEKIPNLLVSTSESGCQDHNTLLDAYKKLDAYIEEKTIVKPVVILSDGHASRFDGDVLSFLREELMRLYISYPDTTAITQLLDQINQNLHSEYRKAKSDLFSSEMTINREGFMWILAEIWDKWATKDIIVAAGKRVGISKNGLNVEWMQQDKFQHAAALLEVSPEKSEVSTPTIESPADVRHGSAEYWKKKFESAMSVVNTISDSSINLENIPGLLKVNKIKPKAAKENIRITQVHGSMEGKQILERVSEIKKEKLEKEKAKENLKAEQQARTSAFYRCKTSCVCEQVPCEAKGLQECSACHNILKSICSRVQCRDENGGKPSMIKPACYKPLRRELHFDTLDDEEEAEDEMDVDSVAGESAQEDASDTNHIENCTDELVEIPMQLVKQGQWVKVLFEEQLYIGQVVQKGKYARVRCLELPYPIKKPQDLERANDACDFGKVYQCREVPELVKDGRKWKWLY